MRRCPREVSPNDSRRHFPPPWLSRLRSALLGERNTDVGWLSDPNAWIGLLTLTGLEIVLGVDNIIFISILSSTLPSGQQARARQLGLMGAFVTRVLLL